MNKIRAPADAEKNLSSSDDETGSHNQLSAIPHHVIWKDSGEMMIREPPKRHASGIMALV